MTDTLLTQSMIDDLIHNPVLAVRVILGDDAILDMPPHEQIRFKIAWVSKFTLDSSGFSTAKTFTIAALAALRIVLLDNDRTQGVVSKTFGQGKLIGKYWDKWLGTSPIFASQIRKRPVKTTGMEYDFNKNNTGWELVSKNGSVAKILPPDLLKEGGRLASERFADGYFDEIHKWPDQKVLELVMFSRVTKPVPRSSHPIYQHHSYCSCTARFKHHPAYKRVEDWMDRMAKGDDKYAVMSFNFRDVPEEERYKSLVDIDTLNLMERSLPSSMFRCEALGEWVDDSEGFYTASMIDAIRTPEVKIQDTRRNQDEVFLAGIDIAHGGQYGKGDDSAIEILKWHNKKLTHVYAEAMHSVRLEQIAARVHKINLDFGGLNTILLDPLGGGLFLVDYLLMDSQQIDGAETMVTPIATRDDDRVVDAQRSLVLLTQGQPEISNPEFGIFGKMVSPSALVNRCHTSFQGAIEHQNIYAPGSLEMEEEAVLSYLDKHPSLLTARQTIDETYLELIAVERVHDDDGKPKLDKFQMMQFTSRIKKDRAYALMYAYIAFLIHMKSRDFDAELEGTGATVSVTEVDYNGSRLTGVLQDKKIVGPFRSTSSHYPKMG